MYVSAPGQKLPFDLLYGVSANVVNRSIWIGLTDWCTQLASAAICKNGGVTKQELREYADGTLVDIFIER
ncbi:hypothetical protein Tco_1574805, partial [Tanacetum coccineum]